MTIIRYLVRETFKNQLTMLFILFLIFFCQKLVRILGAAVDGDIPANLVPSPLGLGVPKMAQLILSLNLFLRLLMVLGKLYTEGKIAVMHICGLDKAALMRAVMILAVLTTTVTATNVTWAGPWSSRHQDEALTGAKTNPGMATLVQGQFQQTTNGSSMLFIGDVDGNDFKDVFLTQIRPKGNARPSVVVADSGHLTQLHDDSQVVTLDQETCFESTVLLRDFRIADLQNYQTIIGHQVVTLDPNDTDQTDMRTSWNTGTDRARVELNWRIALAFTVFMMASMVVPPSMVNPCQGCVLSVLPTMLLYLLFFLIQTSLEPNGGKGKLDPMLWMQTVNLIYLVLTIVLNLWDTVPVRRLRISSSRKEAM